MESIKRDGFVEESIDNKGFAEMTTEECMDLNGGFWETAAAVTATLWFCYSLGEGLGKAYAHYRNGR